MRMSVSLPPPMLRLSWTIASCGALFPNGRSTEMASCPGAPSPPLHAARAGGGAAGGGGSCANATSDDSVQSERSDRVLVVIFMGGLLIVIPTATYARPYPSIDMPQTLLT